MNGSTSHDRPSAAQVAERLVILGFVVLDSTAIPPPDMLERLMADWSEAARADFVFKSRQIRDEFWQQLRDEGVWESLSPDERQYVTTPIHRLTAQQRIDASWRLEAVQVLMWALKLLDELPPYDQQALPTLLESVPRKDVRRFVEGASLRPAGEIDAARDLAELWHWRSRTRQLIAEGRPLEPDESMRALGIETFDDIVRLTAEHCHQRGMLEVVDQDFAAKGQAYRGLSDEQWSQIRSVTMERHFTLNWLCGYAPENRWDETPTDT